MRRLPNRLPVSVVGMSETNGDGSKRQRVVGKNAGSSVAYPEGAPPVGWQRAAAGIDASVVGLRVPDPGGGAAAILPGKVLPDVTSLLCSGKIPLLAKPRCLPKIASSWRKSAMMLALKPCLPMSPQPTSAF